jgi:hypothetical protein
VAYGAVLSNLHMSTIVVSGFTEYDLGKAHGSLACKQIRAFLETPMMCKYRSQTRNYVPGMIARNTMWFPESAQEIAGVACGAGVAESDVWLCNMLYEAELLCRSAGAQGAQGAQDGHCSTFMLRLEDGGIMLGHNEDWDASITEHLYMLDATYKHSNERLRALVYPGQVPGFAVTLSDEGILMTQNSVHHRARPEEQPCTALVGREALRSSTIQGVAATLIRLRGDVCANILSTREGRGATVEVAQESSHFEELETYLWHFNTYRFAANDARAKSCRRTMHEARAVTPKTAQDIRIRLDEARQPGTMQTWQALLSDRTLQVRGPFGVWRMDHSPPQYAELVSLCILWLTLVAGFGAMVWWLIQF